MDAIKAVGAEVADGFGGGDFNGARTRTRRLFAEKTLKRRVAFGL